MGVEGDCVLHEGRSEEELQSDPSGVGDTEGERPTACGAEYEGQCGELCTPSAGSEGSMGYTEDKGCGELDDEQSESGGWQKRRHVDRTSDKQRQEQRKAEPEVGRDFARRLHGVDISELSGLSHSELAEIYEWMVKCDNRTDELRLLGNGVVPATAARAFTVLMEELLA